MICNLGDPMCLRYPVPCTTHSYVKRLISTWYNSFKRALQIVALLQKEIITFFFRHPMHLRHSVRLVYTWHVSFIRDTTHLYETGLIYMCSNTFICGLIYFQGILCIFTTPYDSSIRNTTHLCVIPLIYMKQDSFIWTGLIHRLYDSLIRDATHCPRRRSDLKYLDPEINPVFPDTIVSGFENSWDSWYTKLYHRLRYPIFSTPLKIVSGKTGLIWRSKYFKSDLLREWFIRDATHLYTWYVVATVSRIDKIIGLCCKRAL